MKKRHSAEQIVAMLRQVDVGLGKGLRVPEVCKQLGVSEQTYCRCRQKYGGMSPGLAKQLTVLTMATIPALTASGRLSQASRTQANSARCCRSMAKQEPKTESRSSQTVGQDGLTSGR